MFLILIFSKCRYTTLGLNAYSSFEVLSELHVLKLVAEIRVTLTTSIRTKCQYEMEKEHGDREQAQQQEREERADAKMKEMIHC